MDENRQRPYDTAAPPPPVGGPPPAPWPPAPGQPGGPLPGPEQRSGTDGFFDAIRRSGLVRADDRWIGGVAAGVAQRLGIDPLVVRGVLGVSVLLGGLGLVVYGLGWMFLPEQRDGRIHVQQLIRGDFDIAVLAGLAVFITGLSFPDSVPWLWWGPDSDWWRGVMWISVIAVVVVLIVSATNNRPAPGHTTNLRPGGPVPFGAAGPGPHAAPTDQPGGSTMDPTTPPPAAPATAYPGQGPATAYPTAPYATTPRGTAPLPTAPYPTAPYGTAPYGTSPYGTASYGTAQDTPTQHGAPYPGGQRPGQQAGAYPAGSGGYPQAAYAGQPPFRGGPGVSGPSALPRNPGPVTSLPRPAVKRGPGAGTFGIVVALSLLTTAGLLYAERVGAFTGPVFLTAGAVAVILLGLAVVVSGLRGRTGGGLGALAVLGVLVLLPGAAIHASDPDWNWDVGWDNGSNAVGDLEHVPTDVASAQAGYSMGAGDSTVDLTQVPLSGGAVEVPLQLGAGELTVIVPEGAAVTASIDVLAGEVRWLDGTQTAGVPASRSSTYESPAVQDGAEPDLVLDINVGAGSVRVVEG